MESHSEPESPGKDRSPHRMQLDGSSAQMEKLIFRADDAAASEYLKDLISSAGLKEAWAEMAKKFRSVQTQHAHLMSLSSREALNRDFVTRPEFRAIVQEEYKQVLHDHAKRLAVVEAQAQEEKQARVKLHKDVIELAAHIEEELKLTQPEVAAAHAWLKRLDEQCQDQHQEVLKALKTQKDELHTKEDQLRQEAKLISKNLDTEILERKVIGVEVRKQKEFLNGEAFQRHIEETCSRALESYVRKEVMMNEVHRSTEDMCTPLRVLLAKLEQALMALSEELRKKDEYLESCLESTELRLQAKDEHLSDRINAVMDELPEKATLVAVDDVRGKLLYHVDSLESLHMRLQKEATHKVQEAVARLSEFQVILQDHEHALQHAAEEILHRGTKYDIAVLTDRVEKCASKDKMEGDLKEIREQLSWQSTKIESMQFQNGLSMRSISRRHGHSGMKSGVVSRSSSVASDQMGMGKTLSLKTALSVSQADLTKEDTGARSDTDAKPRLDKGESYVSIPGEGSETAVEDPLETLLNPGAGELQDHLIEQQEQLQILQDQLAEMQQASFMSGSTLTEVVQQQLEFLSQGVFCLGRLCLRPKTGSGGSRQEQCNSLLSHLHSVMHWIIHRQRPAEWDPARLTTIALHGAQVSGEDSGYSPVLKLEEKVRRDEATARSLRRAKAASQPKPTPERTESPEFFTGRQFAMGGQGWQLRSIPAKGAYDDAQRPRTSGAVLGGSLDAKRVLVSTPGVADSAKEEVSLPPLGELLSARGKGKS